MLYFSVRTASSVNMQKLVETIMHPSKGIPHHLKSFDNLMLMLLAHL